MPGVASAAPAEVGSTRAAGTRWDETHSTARSALRAQAHDCARCRSSPRFGGSVRSLCLPEPAMTRRDRPPGSDGSSPPARVIGDVALTIAGLVAARRRMSPRELPTEQAPSGTSTSPTPSPPSESANRKSEGAATPTPRKGYSGRQPWPLPQRMKKRSSVERGDRHRAAVLAGLGRHNEGMRITASNRVLAVQDWNCLAAGIATCSDARLTTSTRVTGGSIAPVSHIHARTMPRRARRQRPWRSQPRGISPRHDVDEFRRRAIGAGADVLKAPRDDRGGCVRSDFGHRTGTGSCWAHRLARRSRRALLPTIERARTGRRG
jgi:hypothetical protein